MISNNVIRQISVILIIVFFGIILFLSSAKFLPAFLGAYTLFILLKDSYNYLVTKRKWWPSVAASLLLFLSFVVMALPLFFLSQTAVKSYSEAVKQGTQFFDMVTDFISATEKKYNIDIIDKSTLGKVSAVVTENVRQVLGKTMNGLANVAIMYFLLYFMLTQNKQMEKKFVEILPLNNKNSKTVEKELNRLVLSNAIGIPLTAIVQGLAALIIFFILGIDNPWLLFILTTLAAMIPILGAALIYVPLSVFLFVKGEHTSGIVMLLYGFIVIGTVDNLFRIWLLKKMGETHALITLFGVLIGLKIFGVIGLIFGPILISLFLLLIKIYSIEFGGKSKAEPPTVRE